MVQGEYQRDFTSVFELFTRYQVGSILTLQFEIHAETDRYMLKNREEVCIVPFLPASIYLAKLIFRKGSRVEESFAILVVRLVVD